MFLGKKLDEKIVIKKKDDEEGTKVINWITCPMGMYYEFKNKKMTDRIHKKL